jgi:hypothetical protein
MDRKDVAERCPVCGKGVVADIAFDAGVRTEAGAPMQEPESREVITYSCGHEVGGAELQTADADRLDVERRSSDETA